MMSRIFAIGDIHGEYLKLTSLMNILYKHHNLDLNIDKLIFMGDYIDRGPMSFEVLLYIKNLQEEYCNNVVALAGNHEYLMLDWYDGRDKWDVWGINGGKATRDSFELNTEGIGRLLKWVGDLPLFHTQPGFFFSHAPIGNNEYRGSTNENYTRDELLWSFNGKLEENVYAKIHANGVVGVCGHIHALFDGVFHPRIYPHYIFTDAGCGCHPKAPLCAVEVVSKEIIYAT
jgi:serine/threonine protein phosphatase 1